MLFAWRLVMKLLLLYLGCLRDCLLCKSVFPCKSALRIVRTADCPMLFKFLKTMRVKWPVKTLLKIIFDIFLQLSPRCPSSPLARAERL